MDIRGAGGAALVVAAVAALLLVTGRCAPTHAQDGEADDPPYPHGDFAEDCALCHSDDGWRPARIAPEFEHVGRFPLRGAHAAAQCRSCHQNLEFRKAPSDCVSCHQDVHRGELGIDCARCHTPRTFIDRAEMTRQHRTTRFPLSGAHAVAECESCHQTVVSGRLSFVGLPAECEACHVGSGFPAAPKRPQSHVEGGYALDCSLCHTTTSFAAARFDHGATAFPLTGAHRGLDCVSCHGEPFQRDLDPACVSCHRDDYDRTSDPPHAAAGFPTDCAACHSTTSFEGAAFDHQSSAFPLTGAHVGLSCTACHADGVYDGKPTDCYSCHRGDYDRTTDPRHSAAGFSTACTQCHTTSTFDGATFAEHESRFPIYSGKHRQGVWNACSDCHTVNTNYTSFSCFQCHGQSETDREHDDVGGYSYDSNACYSCHPRGSE